MHILMGPHTGPVDGLGLASAYPWPRGRRWVRAMMVTTLDGAVAGPDGRSGSISGVADRAVMTEVRRLADVVLVGAATIRAERYRPMLADPGQVAERRALGLAEAPVVVVVSASLDLPWDEALFSQSTVRPVVATVESADAGALRVARKHADVMTLPDGRVDVAQMLEHLDARGLRRVVCEGGPALLASMAAAGLLDEADITISPLIAGGHQMSAGIPMAIPTRFSLAQVIAADGFLMTRYLAESAEGAAEVGSERLHGALR